MAQHKEFYHRAGSRVKGARARKKRRRAIFPRRVFSPPGRLTSEFGMGSGVSARLSPPPREGARPLKTGCHVLVKNRSEDGATYALPRPPGKAGRDGVLGLLERPGSASRLACTGRPSNGSLARALTHSRDGRPRLGSGFALRCSQRLSGPRAASRRCPWRDNRATVAASILVLAY